MTQHTSRMLKIASAAQADSGSDDAWELGLAISMESLKTSTCRRSARWGFRSRDCLQSQVFKSYQVERCESEDEHPIDTIATAMSRFAHRADGLEPTEDFFNAFAPALANQVALMPSSPMINRAASVRRVHRHMRRNVSFTQARDEVARIIAFICTESNLPCSSDRIGHLDGRIALSCPACKGRFIVTKWTTHSVLRSIWSKGRWTKRCAQVVRRSQKSFQRRATEWQPLCKEQRKNPAVARFLWLRGQDLNL